METKHTAARNELTFGIELEYEYITPGIAQAAVLQACANLSVPAELRRCGIMLDDGRVWTVKYDGSLRNRGSETVSPICTTRDIPLVQEIVRCLKIAGAVAGPSAGLHIHVGMQGWTSAQICNLIKVVNKQEAVLHAMLGSREDRVETWCRPIPQAVLAVAERSGSTRSDIRNASASRYEGLNTKALGHHGTLEFRFFEATTHAGVIRANIELVLHMAAYAKAATRTSSKRRVISDSNVKYCARAFLKTIGMVGDQFANCRMHLCKPLDGDSVLYRPSHHGYECWTPGRVAGTAGR